MLLLSLLVVAVVSSRRLATIRAAAEFLPGLLRAGGPRALLRAVEVAPELLELMLDCGADPGAQASSCSAA